MRLEGVEQVTKELRMLSESLIKRMRLDLTSLISDINTDMSFKKEQEVLAIDIKATTSRRWMAHPKTLRLSTRPRPPLDPDGTRSRGSTRISKSSSMPSFVFSLAQDITVLAGKLVEETLMPLFRKLHPEKTGWNISLINLCATNMTVSEEKAGAGRDIGGMLKRQQNVLKDWKIADVDVAPSDNERDDRQVKQDETNNLERGTRGRYHPDYASIGSEDTLPSTQGASFGDEAWDSEDEESFLEDRCQKCGATIPSFAMNAHERFHFLSG